MRFLLFSLLSVFSLTTLLFGQSSERPETIVIPVSSLGEVSEVRKQILQNTLEDELKSHFRLISQERFEEVQEKVFEELEYDECTEEQCIVMIQEMLQVENVFHLQVLGEGVDTQLSLSWRTLDEKRKETDYCEGCKTKELNGKVGGLVEKLVGIEEEVVVKEEPPKKVEPVVVETPKVVPKVVQEPVVQKIEKDKTKGMFVTVGSKGTIVTSLDGISWIKSKSGINNTLIGITFGKDKFVIVGDKITLISLDGRTWKESELYYPYSSITGVTFGNGKFVSVDYSSYVYSSTDGNIWDEVFSRYVSNYGITFGNNLFVYVGHVGYIFYSSDTINWNEIGTTGNTLNGITYGGDNFITVGEKGTIIISKNGVDWEERKSGNIKTLNSVTHGNNQYVTVGDYGTILTSPDGTKWTSRTSGTSNNFNGVTYGNGVFVTIGEKGTILTSSNGTSWTQRTSGTSQSLNGVTYSQ